MGFLVTKGKRRSKACERTLEYAISKLQDVLKTNCWIHSTPSAWKQDDVPHPGVGGGHCGLPYNLDIDSLYLYIQPYFLTLRAIGQSLVLTSTKPPRSGPSF